MVRARRKVRQHALRWPALKGRGQRRTGPCYVRPRVAEASYLSNICGSSPPENGHCCVRLGCPLVPKADIQIKIGLVMGGSPNPPNPPCGSRDRY
jgi:hypothetical protein